MKFEKLETIIDRKNVLIKPIYGNYNFNFNVKHSHSIFSFICLSLLEKKSGVLIFIFTQLNYV